MSGLTTAKQDCQALQTHQTTSDKEFGLFFDKDLAQPTPYHADNDYVQKAKDRIDRTIGLLKSDIRGKAVLDIGASPFYLLYKAQQLGARFCSGVYFSNDEHPLKDAKSVYTKLGIIEIFHADVESKDLPFSDSSMDVVFACEVLEHLDYFPERLAKEIHRVIRPGGLLCITVPNAASIANIIRLISQKNIYMKYRADPTGRHKHEYTVSQLKSFMNFMGFDLVSTGFLPTPTSDKYYLRPVYRLLSMIPGLKRYSPSIYAIAKCPASKSEEISSRFPEDLYTDSLAIEE